MSVLLLSPACLRRSAARVGEGRRPLRREGEKRRSVPCPPEGVKRGVRNSLGINDVCMKAVAETDREPTSRFTTISGRPIERLYTAADVADVRVRARRERSGRLPLHARHPRHRLSRQALDDAPVRRASARRRRRTSATRRCLRAGGTGLSVAFDLPTLMGRDPDHELSLGEVGKCGVNVTSLADMETLFDGIAPRRHHDVDDDQLAGGDDLRDVSRRRREAGRRLEDAFRHDPERHPQRVHRAEGVHLSAASRRCGSSPTSSRSAPSEAPKWNTISVSGYHIREAGSTAAAGAGVHAARRHRVRAVGRRRRARRRRVRAADVVLLQRAQRLLRGDRQVPRGAEDLGAR